MDRALGTAAWIDPADVIADHEYAPGALWLGRSPTDDETAIGFMGDDRHICLVSGSRGGKGTTIIVNNLALWPGSLVVIDPKGENASVSACRRGPGSQYCRGLGQAVHVLDPFGAARVPDSLRSRFNPLDALDIDREETIDEAGRVADALVVSNPESKDPFWDESARAMLKSLILHVLTSEEFEGRRNLITIRDLLTRGDAEKVQVLKEMGETEIQSAQELLWEGVSTNPHFGGVIMRTGSSIKSMLESSPKQYESVRQVADRNTEFIDSPGMRRILEASDFKLSDLKTKREGVSLYLSLPQRYMETHFRWLRMMISLTITEMEAMPGKSACGHRVLFCLDEFAGMRRMPVIENAVAQIAGYDVKLMFVLQSLEQLKGTYKEKWETFLSNCGIKIFFGIEDYFTREHVSKLIGDMEVTRTSRTSSETKGKQTGRTDTIGHSTGKSRSEQISYTVSDTNTKSTGKSKSTAKGRNRGRSWGSQWGLNLGHNSSNGATWKPQLFFGRDDEKLSDGSGWSQGANYGRNKGENEGDNFTLTTGENTGESIAHGISKSQSEGFTTSETHSQSQSISHSDSQSSTEGLNESVHKRRLITEDEIGRVFPRLSKKEHPAYPGLALVLAAGEQPIFLRKVNYFEDPQFIDCYDPHPIHPYRPLVEHNVPLLGPHTNILEALNRHATTPFYVAHIFNEEGERVRAGQPLCEIRGEAFGARTATIKAPVSGRISDLPIEESERLTAGTLAVVTYYDYGDEQNPVNPHEELESLLAAIEADRLRSIKPPAESGTESEPVPPREQSHISNIVFAAVFMTFVFVLAFMLMQRTHGDDTDISDWAEHEDTTQEQREQACIDLGKLSKDGFSDYYDSDNFLAFHYNDKIKVLSRFSRAKMCMTRLKRWRFSPSKQILQIPSFLPWSWETLHKNKQ